MSCPLNTIVLGSSLKSYVPTKSGAGSESLLMD